MEDPRKSKGLPDQIVHGLKLEWGDPGNKKKNIPNCKQHAAAGIFEVSPDDRDYFKVIANPLLKLEQPKASSTSFDARTKQCIQEHVGKLKRQHVDHIVERVMLEASALAQYTSQFLVMRLL